MKEMPILKVGLTALGFLVGYGAGQLHAKLRREGEIDWQGVLEAVAAKSGMKMLINPTAAELAATKKKLPEGVLLQETGKLLPDAIREHEVVFAIEDGDDNFLGEIGIGTQARAAGFMEFWLFDKNDPKTSSKLFALGNEFEHDAVEQVVFVPYDWVIIIFTFNLKAELRLTNVVFGEDQVSSADYAVTVWKK